VWGVTTPTGSPSSGWLLPPMLGSLPLHSCRLAFDIRRHTDGYSCPPAVVSIYLPPHTQLGGHLPSVLGGSPPLSGCAGPYPTNSGVGCSMFRPPRWRETQQHYGGGAFGGYSDSSVGLLLGGIYTPPFEYVQQVNFYPPEPTGEPYASIEGVVPRSGGVSLPSFASTSIGHPFVSIQGVPNRPTRPLRRGGGPGDPPPVGGGHPTTLSDSFHMVVPLFLTHYGGLLAPVSLAYLARGGFRA